MKQFSMFGSMIRTIRTTDAQHDGGDEAAVDRIMHGITTALGPLRAVDAARVRGILTAHSGGSGGFTPDVAFNAANRRAQAERLREIGQRNADFWNGQAADQA